MRAMKDDDHWFFWILQDCHEELKDLYKNDANVHVIDMKQKTVYLQNI